MAESEPSQPAAMFALSDIGCIREKNEDSLHIDPGLGLAVLADGMGGHRAGDVASQLAVDTVVEMMLLADRQKDLQNLLRKSLLQANQEVYESSRKNTDQFGMGTTLVAALLQGNLAHIAHVGDSRAYLLDKDKLTQVTEDHTYLAQIERLGADAGQIIADSAVAKMLVRAIGIEPEVEIDHCEIPLKPGDCLLLCSDGLTDMLSDEEIRDILLQNKQGESTAEKLIQQANRKGGPDNVSVILICP
ncbi:MAG: Stp1/IreP family PP2C-type Ser/Thr phosphatase [Gammaproteobacteria bacterium]|nr:MAG: Stp1/IreP family PP2C-type Ser/Thr phosphatase [Gammaproteobacteria bacterium]